MSGWGRASGGGVRGRRHRLLQCFNPAALMPVRRKIAPAAACCRTMHNASSCGRPWLPRLLPHHCIRCWKHREGGESKSDRPATAARRPCPWALPAPVVQPAYIQHLSTVSTAPCTAPDQAAVASERNNPANEPGCGPRRPAAGPQVGAAASGGPGASVCSRRRRRCSRHRAAAPPAPAQHAPGGSPSGGPCACGTSCHSRASAAAAAAAGGSRAAGAASARQAAGASQ